MKQGKLIRRAVSAALAGCMMFTLSAPALAESTDALMQLSTAAKSAVSVLDAENGVTVDYGITVTHGEKAISVTSANCGNILGNGTLSYDPAAKKLTYNGNNGTITGELTIDAPNVDVELTGNSSIIDGYSTNLNIKNARNVTLSTNSFPVVGGMYGGNVEINCSGKLTIKNSDFTWSAIKGDLTVHNALEILVEGLFSTVVGGDVKIECACPATFKNNQNGGIARSITYAGDYVYYTSDAADAEAVDPNVTSIPAKTAKYVRIVPKVSYTIMADDATITVDGEAVNSAFAGEEVTVTAAGRKNAEFTGWTAEGITLTDDQKANPTVTFTMPDKNVTLTPSYKQYYTITSTDDVTIKVDNDRSTATAKALEGQHIVALANNKNGYVFENWEVDGVTLNTSNSVNYTNFEMPANNVTLKPNYAKLHAITVLKGIATLTEAKEGTEVTIKAENRPGYVFDRWVVNKGDVELTDAKSMTTTFTVKGEDVEVEAKYKELHGIAIEGGTFTVNGGTAATAKKGDAIVATADSAPAGQKFSHWEVTGVDGLTEKQLKNETLEFTMPKGEVTLKAVFKTLHTIGVKFSTADKDTAIEGETVTIKAESRPGYVFDRWEVNNGDVAVVNKNAEETTFVMPDAPVTAVAKYKKLLGITVNSGKAYVEDAVTDAALKGKLVVIKADEIEGKRFDQWKIVSGDVILDNQRAPETKFTMPETAVEITAVYNDLHAITVHNGNADVEEAVIGDTVKITAKSREGYVFDHWEASDGVELTEDGLTAKFTMPDHDVTIEAKYKQYHSIEVSKGTAYDADGKEITSAVVGDKITIVANDRDSHEFNRWEIDPDNVILEDPNADETAFIMPDEPVSVEAKYKHLQSITMNHGTAYDEDFSETDIAKAKQTITIKAEDRYADGLVFDHWTVDTDNVTLADEYGEKTTFEMVNGAVELTAHYKARVTVFSVPAKFEEGIGEHSDETWEKVGKTATITAEIDEETFPGMEFDYWEVIPTDLDIGDIHSPTISFEVPECEVKLVAHWKASGMNPIVDPDEDLDPGFGVEPESSDGGAGAAGAIVVGAALGGAAIWGGYEIATRVILHNLLPEGAAIPANRGQLALLIWTEKGKPEPAAQPAFADITDAEQAKAAQWCVEQGLLDAREGKFESDGWMPKFKTIEIWNKAFPKK